MCCAAESYDPRHFSEGQNEDMSHTMPLYYTTVYPQYHPGPAVIHPGEAFPISPEQMYYYHQDIFSHQRPYSYNNAFVAAQAMQQLSSAQSGPPHLVVARDFSGKADCRGVDKQYTNSEPPKPKTNAAVPRRRVYKFKRRAKSEKKSWTRSEIILALQAAKLLLHKDLKTITKAIYACIDRKPGKCWGRGAEKKLKRILGFQNWRTADKEQISKRIDVQLRKYEADIISEDSKVYKVAQKLSAEE